VFAVPIVVDLAINSRRAFGYLVPDVFYYLTIARNHHELGIWSFDGEHPTNGYHPLWQWLLRPLWGLLAALGGEASIFSVLMLVSVALISGALVLLGGAMLRARRTVSPLFPLLVPGFTALVSTPMYQPAHDREAFQDPAAARPIFTTMWSFANGMETPLLILVFAGCVWFFVRRPRLDSNASAMGLAALLLTLTLARLDHVFFAGVLLMAFLAPAWRDRDRDAVRRGLLAGAVFALGVLVYMIGNKLSFGVSMPISGVSKSSFPRVSLATLRTLARMLANPPEQWLMNAARLHQLLFPMLVALVYLPLNLRFSRQRPYLELRPGRDRIDALLCWTALGVLALGAYNTFYVLLIHTGPWYFPLSALFVSLAVITSLERLAPVRRLSAFPHAALASLAIVLGVAAGYFVRAQYQPLYLAEQATFYYDEAPLIREYYRERGEVPKLLEFDDGIVTFATGFPAMSGHGLALDTEAMAAKKRGALMELALERGYDHIASLNYVQLTEPGPLTSNHAFRAYKWIKKDERQQLEFVPEYHSPRSGFAIFKVVRKPTVDEVEAETGTEDDEG
jgi:hypothetical protein